MVELIDKIIASLFSILLIVLGRFMRKSESSKLRLHKQNEDSTVISTKQIIRRILCSYLIIGLGILIFAGFILLDLENYPVVFSIYWGICFLMVFLLLILSYGDIKEILFHYYGKPLNDIMPPKSQSKNDKQSDS
jgi:hypothetical protein